MISVAKRVSRGKKKNLSRDNTIGIDTRTLSHSIVIRQTGARFYRKRLFCEKITGITSEVLPENNISRILFVGSTR